MTATLHIVFRADASVRIGTGHVMRCLTLADALAAEGCECHFLYRNLTSHMMTVITGRGHGVTALPPPEPYQTESLQVLSAGPPHASWLGVPLETEIKQSREALEKLAPDLVVVDHYALDARWETRAVPSNTPVMVIDDLADRPHSCDTLLDQNLGRSASDYDGLVPPNCKRLIGPKFALLRPEFVKLRSSALARRKGARLENLLITLGGVDKDNVTTGILQIISELELRPNLQVTVIMGKSAPFLESVRAQAEGMPCSTHVISGVSNMAELMAQADLCIGAAGSTSWERCATGLPTLLMVLAENQRASALALVESGAAVLLGDKLGEKQHRLLQKYLGMEAELDMLRQISSAAADLVDGLGCLRILGHIEPNWGQLRPADCKDIPSIWEWRYSDHAERFYRVQEVPTLDAHTVWMKKALSDPLRDLRIFCYAGQPVAHIRFDIKPDNPKVAEISICISQAARGQKVGQRALAAAVASPPSGVKRLNAEVHRSNVASAIIFEKLGFRRLRTDGNFLQMTLELST